MTTKKAKAKKTDVVLNDLQSAIARKYSALSTKGADAYNSLTAYSQDFMSAAVLFDGTWADEAIEDLNTSLKAIQSKLERKSTGYSTFSSAKATILKAFRLGVADVRMPKDELAKACKAIEAAAKAEASENPEASETEEGTVENMGRILAELSPQDLIRQALEMLIQSGDSSPVKTAQGLLILASNNLKNKK